MSVRARNARRLASLLTTAAGVHVILRYQRDRDHYRVAWTGGPDIDAMRVLAYRCAAEVEALDLSGLDWHRAGE